MPDLFGCGSDSGSEPAATPVSARPQDLFHAGSDTDDGAEASAAAAPVGAAASALVPLGASASALAERGAAASALVPHGAAAPVTPHGAAAPVMSSRSFTRMPSKSRHE